jgi:hypothetical protein
MRLRDPVIEIAVDLAADVVYYHLTKIVIKDDAYNEHAHY